MSNLVVSVAFTENGGDDPAIGLALADIDLYLTSVNITTGVDTVIWNGTQNPTEEIDNIGAYSRIYNAADFSTNVYMARGTYTGATVLDSDTVTGSAGLDLESIGDEVNDQVIDVLTVDTFAQPGQESPVATTSLMNMIRYLYKAFRNKLTQTATSLSIYNDAGAVIDQKATVSDDGTTFTRGEIETGP